MNTLLTSLMLIIMTHEMPKLPYANNALEPVISIIKLGFSVFIEQILMRVGFMSTAMMAAKMGTNALAAHQVV